MRGRGDPSAARAAATLGQLRARSHARQWWWFDAQVIFDVPHALDLAHDLLDRVAVLLGDDLALHADAAILCDDLQSIDPDGRVTQHGRFDTTGECQIAQALSIERRWLQHAAGYDGRDHLDRLVHAEPACV